MTQTKYTAGAFLAVVLSLFMPTFLEAQVTIYATDHTVQPGEEFEVEIRVRDFSEIIGCQFSVEWNENHLRLKEAGNLNPDLETALDNFNLSAVDTGQLGFAWLDLSLANLTFEDDTPLFTMEFEVITDQTVTDSIFFGGVPVAVEVADKDENVLDVTFEAGTIQIDGISSVLERNGQETLSITSSPNPFVAAPQIMLDFHRSTTATLSLYHPNGQLVYTQPASFYAEGEHNLRLPDEAFTASGIYLLKVHSTDFIITHKMIAQ
jgi:hypothetical protein